MRSLAVFFLLSQFLQAAPAKVHVATGSTAGSVLSAAVNTSAFAATTGNLIVVFARQGTSPSLDGTVSDTAGNVYVLIANAPVGTNGRCGMWYASNVAGNGSNVVTVTFSNPVAYTAVSAIEYSGIDTVAPFDRSATGVVTGAGSVTSGFFATTAANELAVAGASAGNSGNTFAGSTGYTIEAQDAAGFGAVEDQIFTSVGTQATATLSGGSATDWGMIVATFKEPGVDSYQFHRPIVIDHTKVGTSDSANFTMLITGTYSYLATVANSGRIRQTTLCGPNAVTCPADLIYTSDSACKVALAWEFESYSPSTGALTVWVRVPAVSHTFDTTIYECYGNVASGSYRGGPRGAAWDDNFKLVQHLGSGATLSTWDSTANGNITTPSNAAGAAGKIGGAVSLSGSSTSNLSVASDPGLDGNTGTWSGWIKTSQSAAGNYLLLWSRADAYGSREGISLFLNSHTAQLRVQVQSAYGTVLDIVGGIALNDGAWHHIAFTFAGTGLAILYTDGSAVASGNPGAAWFFNGQVLRTGAALDPFWTPLNGLSDEFQLSNSARSADWIRTEFNNQVNPSTFYTIGAETGPPAMAAPASGSQPVLG